MRVFDDLKKEMNIILTHFTRILTKSWLQAGLSKKYFYFRHGQT